MMTYLVLLCWISPVTSAFEEEEEEEEELV